MPKPIRFTYQKKEPFRDSFLFIIICEGQNREPDYFNFFDGLSSRVKIVPIRSGHGSSPSQLITKALEVEKEFSLNPTEDKLWFVIDTDRWGLHLHTIREETSRHQNWNIAQSNPCFEVWLYFHVLKFLPDAGDISSCGFWKPLLARIIDGGFNSDFHPIAIEFAIENARINYQSTGYFPNPGSSELWKLAEQLLPPKVSDSY
ncbi:RloB family protein [Flavihumibacter sp. UBA7668]|uniref:RloB family protein n=1 Tax=Flavihumibacter sp. UBA7668 TaxID=1946542 RepID=UPI0025C035C0|nr:RloB family protein [Flavihumibacter sp. UBA7668]